MVVELDFLVQELERLKEKQKSLRLRMHLENAVREIKEFQKISEK